MESVLFNSWSLCPVCLKRVAARRVERGGEVYQEKECPEHGAFKTPLWRGYYDYTGWVGEADVPFEEEPACPDNCGLCSDHLQKTCCTLLHVTDQCNLACPYCLADQHNDRVNPSLNELRESLAGFVIRDKTLVQLSGGEPTTRDDLPEIVAAAKEAGAKYVQLNTNGIRLGEDKEYLKRLVEAGLSFVFMQFDGVDDEVNIRLRGMPLLKVKQQAIENCAGFNLGVTLVSMLVRGVTLERIGQLICYGAENSPAVRGIHLQPLSWFGRTASLPDPADRITMDEVLYQIEKQTAGMVKKENLSPSCCDHPLCKFHGDFVIDNNNLLIPLSTKKMGADAVCSPQTASDRNREFIARRWQRSRPDLNYAGSEQKDMQDMDYFLYRVKNNGFTITSMMFQDAGNIDFARLRKCGFHVYDQGRLIPFCSYYLTSWNR